MREKKTDQRHFVGEACCVVSLGHPGGISSQLEQSGEIVMLRSLPVESGWSLNPWRLDFFSPICIQYYLLHYAPNTSYQLSHLEGCPMNGGS